MKFQYSTLQLLLIFAATSCVRYPPDPVDIHQVSEARINEWVPCKPCAVACSDRDTILPCKTKALNLVELVDIALYNNPATHQSWAIARASAFLVGEAQSALYPSLTENIQLLATKQVNNRATINLGPDGNQTSLFPEYFTSLQKTLTIDYLLLDFGGREATICSAEEALYASNLLHNRTIQTVIFNLLQAYYNYMGSKEQLNARIADVKTAKQSLDAAEKMFEAGVGTKLDVLQTRSNLINNELGLVNAEGTMRINFGILVNALGLPPETCFDIADMPEDLPSEDICDNIDEFIRLAREERPDLAASFATVIQKEADLITAVSNSLPTLSAIANLEDTHYFTPGLRNTKEHIAGISLNIPLFDGFFYKNSIRYANEQIEIAEAQKDALELNVVLDVVTSYWNFKTAVKTYKFSEEYLKYAQEAYIAALEKYKAGVGTILDVLSTQDALANARFQLIQSKTNWYVSLANISYSTGTIDLAEVKCQTR